MRLCVSFCVKNLPIQTRFRERKIRCSHPQVVSLPAAYALHSVLAVKDVHKPFLASLRNLHPFVELAPLHRLQSRITGIVAIALEGGYKQHPMLQWPITCKDWLDPALAMLLRGLSFASHSHRVSGQGQRNLSLTCISGPVTRIRLLTRIQQ
jgi:hypothetical protein